MHGLDTTELNRLGIDYRNIREVENLTELRKNPPNMVVAKAKMTVSFERSEAKQPFARLKNTKDYVMSLGMYQQLRYNVYAGPAQKRILAPSQYKFPKYYSPYIGQDLTDKALLVWRTGGIGDLLFIQPNLIWLKEQYPSSYIIFGCGNQYRPLVDNWGCIDELITFPFPFSYLRSADYHATFEGVIERCKEAHHVNAYKLFSTWLGLDIPDEKLKPFLEAKKNKIKNVRKILRGNWGLENEEFVVIQMRSSSPIRNPSPSFWASVLKALDERGFHLVLTDLPHYADQIDSFIKQTKIKNIYNFSRYSESLDSSIALISQSCGVVATDTSMMHIASGLEVPLFGFYGPFPGEIRLSTYEMVDWINAPAECAPCFLHGHKPCYKAKNYWSPCYDEIDVNVATDRIEHLFRNKTAKEETG